MSCMQSSFIRKLTFSLQLRHLKNSMKEDGIDWYNCVDDVVILGAIPLRNKSKWISELGLGGVISLNESFENKKTLSVAEWDEMGIANFKFKVADHIGAASVEQAIQIINFIKEQGIGEKRVYVHCKAGKGRSASVVMCYLCQKHQISAEESFDMLKSKRKQIDLNRKQWKLVTDYCSSLNLPESNF